MRIGKKLISVLTSLSLIVPQFGTPAAAVLAQEEDSARIENISEDIQPETEIQGDEDAAGQQKSALSTSPSLEKQYKWGTCTVSEYSDGSMEIGAGKPLTRSGYYIELASKPWGSSTTSITFKSGFDLSEVTSLKSLFAGCSNVTNIDLTYFDTSNVVNMESMFQGAFKLQNLDLTRLKTSNVTNMKYMFYYCTGLKNVNLSKLDTSSVTDMESMFEGCSSLEAVDVSSFNTSNVTDMWGMFLDCRKLKSVDISGFDTSKVTNMVAMFGGCSSLTNINMSGLDTRSLKKTTNMFKDCTSLMTLDLSSFNTENVFDMYRMFLNCSSLVSLDISNFTTSGLDDAAYAIGDIFSGCTSLERINLSSEYFNQSYTGQNFPRTEDTVWQQESNPKNQKTWSEMAASWNQESAGWWRLPKATLTFETNGGSLIDPVLKEYGTEVDLSAFEPVRKGYTFTGWFSDKNLKTKVDSVVLDTDATVYAGWQINQYTLTFNTNGGSILPSVTEDFGTEINLSDYQPVRDGHTFTGWYSEETLENKVEKIALAEDTTVYAGWQINQYTLTFDTNGGSKIASLSMDFGTEINLNNYQPVREGCVFTGWYNDKSLSTKIDTLILNANTTVYAGWEICQHTLNFETDGGSEISAITADYGTEIDLAQYVPVKAEHAFTGWFKDPDLEEKVSSIVLKSDMTVYAGWKINQYTLNFETNSGSGISPVTADYGTVINLGKYIPERTGYGFAGWYRDPDLKDQIESITLESDTTVYAKWQINRYTLRFETNGGNTITPVSAEHGAEIDLKQYVPVRTGYGFAGWYFDSDLSRKAETIILESDVTVYADWRINQYILHFETNGGNLISPVLADYGTLIDLSQYVPEKPGYTFIGWFSDEELTKPAETVRLESDVTVYALWQINQYTLEFEANGGSSVSPVTADYKTIVDLDEFVPQKRGYTFTGWFSDKDLNNQIKSVELTKDTIVYAGWQINEYSLRFETNGGSLIKPVKADYGTEINLSQYVPEKTGYTFTGWYSDEPMTKPVESIRLQSDTVVYAGWKINEYTLNFETNGGSSISPVSGVFGAEIDLNDYISKKSGYVFTGWYSDAALRNKVDRVKLTDDTVVYAGWQVGQHTLKFEVSGGKSVPAVNADYGTEIDLSKYTTEKAGFTFTGWYSDSDQKNRIETIRLETDTIVYAGWKINQYAINFETNGGSTVSPAAVNYGTEVNLNEYTSKKDGYSFTGWYSDKNLTNKAVRITVTSDITVYAGWKKEESASTIMYRLYNPNSGEHFYTASEYERDHLGSLGWVKEGIAWTAPKLSGTPVYRLYNPNAGDHHYTTDINERDTLTRAGWKYEGIGWYSDESKSVSVYRLYNPNATGAGAHHYTVDANEYRQLASIGWKQEGIGWYGVK